MNFARYALYATFGPGPLGDALADWLGWDSATGTSRKQPDLALPGGLDVPHITNRPRKYGAHGTINPPFRLAPGHNEVDLRRALFEMCRTTRAVALPRLQIARLGRFLALVPMEACPALQTLAAQTVRDLDHFRAAPSEAELENRKKSRLSARQLAHLDRWGYPHVMEDFKFHITLTGPLPRAHLDDVHRALQDHLSPYLAQPMKLDALSLMGEQSASGMFHVIDRIALTG